MFQCLREHYFLNFFSRCFLPQGESIYFLRQRSLTINANVMIQLLQDRVAIIAGNSRATTFSTARLFLQHGASVSIVGEYPGFTEEALGADRHRWMTVPVNMNNRAEARYCVADTLNRFGQADAFFYYPRMESHDFFVRSTVPSQSKTVQYIRSLWAEIATTLPILRPHQHGNLVVVSDHTQEAELTPAEDIIADECRISVDVINTMQCYYPKRQQHLAYRQLTPERIARLALSLLLREKQQETEWNQVMEWSSDYLDAAS